MADLSWVENVLSGAPHTAGQAAAALGTCTSSDAGTPRSQGAGRRGLHRPTAIRQQIHAPTDSTSSVGYGQVSRWPSTGPPASTDAAGRVPSSGGGTAPAWPAGSDGQAAPRINSLSLTASPAAAAASRGKRRQRCRSGAGLDAPMDRDTARSLQGAPTGVSACAGPEPPPSKRQCQLCDCSVAGGARGWRTHLGGMRHRRQVPESHSSSPGYDFHARPDLASLALTRCTNVFMRSELLLHSVNPAPAGMAAYNPECCSCMGRAWIGPCNG